MTDPTLQSACALDVSNVSIDLGGRHILDNVDFQVASGEFVGLIGPNGAGKTTLMRAVLGDVFPAEGTIAVLGRSRPLIGEVGYVPQHINLDPDLPLRAYDLVALGLDGHRFGFVRRNRAFKERVHAALRGVGAKDLADQPVGHLSGGQQQRIMIATAIVSNPSLLLLDEPLANLDPASGADIVHLLDALRRKYAMSVMLSAHDVNPLLKVLDHVVYLASGHAASGRVDEIIRTDVLSQLYNHPIEVIRSEGRIVVLADDNTVHHDGETSWEDGGWSC